MWGERTEGLPGRGILPQCLRVPRNRKFLLFLAVSILAGHKCLSRRNDPRLHDLLKVVPLGVLPAVPRRNPQGGPLAVLPEDPGEVLFVCLRVHPSVGSD